MQTSNLIFLLSFILLTNLIYCSLRGSVSEQTQKSINFLNNNFQIKPQSNLLQTYTEAVHEVPEAQLNIQQSHGEGPKRHEYDIFYESLCPYCRQFITENVAEVMKDPVLRNLVKLNFHPYGKTEDKSKGLDFKFKCQHGENECFGNKIQKCALSKMDYENGVNFVICFMTAIPLVRTDMSSALYSCVPKDMVMYKKIMDCAYKAEGDLLMQQEGRITGVLDHVPAIAVDGKYNEDQETDIRYSLRDNTCKKDNNMELKECKTSNGNVDQLLKDKIKEISKNQ